MLLTIFFKFYCFAVFNLFFLAAIELKDRWKLNILFIWKKKEFYVMWAMSILLSFFFIIIVSYEAMFSVKTWLLFMINYMSLKYAVELHWIDFLFFLFRVNLMLSWPCNFCWDSVKREEMERKNVKKFKYLFNEKI